MKTGKLTGISSFSFTSAIIYQSSRSCGSWQTNLRLKRIPLHARGILIKKDFPGIGKEPRNTAALHASASDDTHRRIVVLAFDVNKIWLLATRSCLPLTRLSSTAYQASYFAAITFNTTEAHPWSVQTPII